MRLIAVSATKRSTEHNAESLRTQGLIQPITVRPNSEGYEIVAGSRRFRAAHLAEMDEIPVRVVQLSDEQALEWQLVELSIVGKSFRCLHAVLQIVYQWYFGMKAHVGVDSRTKLIPPALVTPANVADATVLPDLLHGEPVSREAQHSPQE
jgi:IS5 family transposase